MREFLSSGDRRSWSAFALVVTSATGTAASIGMALARAVPADVPGYVSVSLSAMLLALNVVALRLDPQRDSRGAIGRLGLCGLALLGPVWTACVWAAGWPTIVWLATLVLGGVTSSLLWVSHSEPDEVQSQLDATGDPVVPGASEPALRTEAATPVQPRLADTPVESIDGLLLRMERRMADQEEIIEVEWRLTFDAGQQQRTLHLPIAPPLAAAPEVECEPLDGDDVIVKVGTALAYGLRLEVRRTGDIAQSATVAIGLVLRAPLQAAAA